MSSAVRTVSFFFIILHLAQSTPVELRIREAKYHHIFNTYLDFNKDGVYDTRDTKSIANKLAGTRGWSSEDDKSMELRYELLKINNILVNAADLDKDNQITSEEFLALSDDDTKERKSAEWQTLLSQIWFRFNDADDDGVITKKEFLEVNSLQSTNHNANLAFQFASGGKDNITKDEYYQLWKDLFM